MPSQADIWPGHDRVDEWARAALQGDRQASAFLVPPVSARAWPATYYGSADEADRADAIALAWEAWFDGSAVWDEVRPFSPWFNGVARKKLLSILRGSGPDTKSLSPRGDDQPGLDLPEREKDEPEPDDEPVDYRPKTKECWSKLSGEQRKTIELRFGKQAVPKFLKALEAYDAEEIARIMGKLPSCKEIAAKLGVTEATVRGRIFRALDGFRTCLGLSPPRGGPIRPSD